MIKQQEKLLPNLMMVLSAFCGIGSIVLFIVDPRGSWPVFRAPRDNNWSITSILIWNALLSLMFFAQHSGMVRQGFRARLAAHSIPAHYHRAIYSIASGISLSAVALFWQPINDRYVFVLTDAVEHPLILGVLIQIGKLSAIAFFVWGIIALGDFDPLGLSPVQDYMNKRQERQPAFVVRGPYRWVRHPLYFSILVIFWLEPVLTLDRILFDILWTAWIWMATILEERDLAEVFGAVYLEYQQSVPMLIPWQGPFVKYKVP